MPEPGGFNDLHNQYHHHPHHDDHHHHHHHNPHHHHGAFEGFLRGLQREHESLARHCEGLVSENAHLKARLEQHKRGDHIKSKDPSAWYADLPIENRVPDTQTLQMHEGQYFVEEGTKLVIVEDETKLANVEEVAPHASVDSRVVMAQIVEEGTELAIPAANGNHVPKVARISTKPDSVRWMSRISADDDDGEDDAEAPTAQLSSPFRVESTDRTSWTSDQADTVSFKTNQTGASFFSSSPTLKRQQSKLRSKAAQHVQQQMMDVFHELDGDGNGSLSVAELRDALVEVGIPQARLIKLIRIADADSSGEVDMDEWKNAVANSSTAEMCLMAQALANKQLIDGTLFSKKKPANRPCMLEPTSGVRAIWDMFVSSLCVYIAFMLPFSVAFDTSIASDVLEALNNIDRIINYFFIMDIVMNFRTAYFNRSQQVVYSNKKVAWHYMKTWFLVDIVSSFPIDELAASPGINLQFAKLFKIFKLVKLVKIISPKAADYEGMSDSFDDLTQSKLAQMVYRRSSVVVNMTLLTHWMACGMKMVDQGFLSGYKDVDGDLWREYLAALYWSMTTITTVGYGDIIPTTDHERAYCIASMVVGGAFYGYVVGSITSIVANNDLNASAYYDRMDIIYAWLSYHRFPIKLQRHLRSYFKGHLTEKSAVCEADIWQDLSPELQKEVGCYMVHEHVSNNPLFDGMGTASVVRLQSILRRFMIQPGHKVTEKGELGSAMYFVVDGWLEMNTFGNADSEESETEAMAASSWASLAQDGVIRLGPGQSFGEEVLLGLVETYAYTVTVSEKSKLEMIFENEFNDIFQSMPNELERMKMNTLELHPNLGDHHMDHMRQAGFPLRGPSVFPTSRHSTPSRMSERTRPSEREISFDKSSS